MLALLSGLAAGCAHVVTGPDHLAALAPLAAEDRSKAVHTGAAWGLGHGAGVAILGGIGMAVGSAIDVEALSQWSEFAVGFLLIAIGLWALARLSKTTLHLHEHEHDGSEHVHLHLHKGHEHAHAGHTHAAFGVGMLHGAAGTGHLFGVLPSLALPPAQAAIYLSAYLFAAIVSMAGFGWLVGKVAARGPRVLRGLMTTAAVGAIGIGIFWIGSSGQL